MTFEKPEAVNCRFCGGLVTVSNDVDAAQHAVCEARFVLDHLVPTWPNDTFHRQELARWRAGWPQFDWEARWTQSHAPIYRSIPMRAKTVPIRGAEVLRASGGPSARPEKADRRAWSVHCKSPNCHFHRQVFEPHFVADIVREHHAESPGHQLGYTVEVVSAERESAGSPVR